MTSTYKKNWCSIQLRIDSYEIILFDLFHYNQKLWCQQMQPGPKWGHFGGHGGHTWGQYLSNKSNYITIEWPTEEPSPAPTSIPSPAPFLPTTPPRRPTITRRPTVTRPPRRHLGHDDMCYQMITSCLVSANDMNCCQTSYDPCGPSKVLTPVCSGWKVEKTPTCLEKGTKCVGSTTGPGHFGSERMKGVFVSPNEYLPVVETKLECRFCCIGAKNGYCKWSEELNRSIIGGWS